MEKPSIKKRITNLVLLMREEIKFVHQKTQLPLFPVYYDIFLIDDLLLAPTIINSKYPGVDVVTFPGGSSMTCLAEDTFGNKGIIVLFSLKRQEEDPTIEESITFESTNLAWQILDILDIKINIDNCKVHSYIVQNIHESISTLYKNFLEDENSSGNENDDSDDLGNI